MRVPIILIFLFFAATYFPFVDIFVDLHLSEAMPMNENLSNTSSASPKLVNTHTVPQFRAFSADLPNRISSGPNFSTNTTISIGNVSNTHNIPIDIYYNSYRPQGLLLNHLERCKIIMNQALIETKTNIAHHSPADSANVTPSMQDFLNNTPSSVRQVDKTYFVLDPVSNYMYRPNAIFPTGLENGEIIPNQGVVEANVGVVYNSSVDAANITLSLQEACHIHTNLDSNRTPVVGRKYFLPNNYADASNALSHLRSDGNRVIRFGQGDTALSLESNSLTSVINHPHRCDSSIDDRDFVQPTFAVGDAIVTNIIGGQSSEILMPRIPKFDPNGFMGVDASPIFNNSSNQRFTSIDVSLLFQLDPNVATNTLPN